MFKTFFKIALRNQFKNRSSSLINIGGLAVGMAVAILIGLWIYDELSFDTYHKNYDRIVRVMQNRTYNGKIESEVSMPFPVGEGLQKEHGGDFKYVVMASWESSHILIAGDKKLSRSGIYMDKDAPAMFSLKMLKGDYKGLETPNSILLAASTARALFGDKDPVGQLIKIDNKLNVTVTGVFDDLPENTDFRTLRFIAPWSLYITSENWIAKAKQQAQWDNNSFQCLAQLAPGADLATVNKKIANLKYEHDAPEDKSYKCQLFLHPMRDWHLRSSWEDGRQSGGQITYVWLFGAIGIFVLLLACINFMNLSTARSEKRAKEVGIRKAIGSVRNQLISQFYIESLLITVFAFIVSLLLTQALLPWFNEVAGKKMHLPWTSPYFWLAGIIFAFITALIAGSYPALYLSSFQPIKVLKGTFKVGRLASLPRKALVVVQFTVSLTLIIGTIIVYNQIQYTRNRPIGYNREGVMMIQMQSPDFYGKYGMLRTGLKNTGAVTEMAESSSPLTEIWSSNDGFDWPGRPPSLPTEFNTIWSSPEYGRLIDWKIKEGRDFSEDFHSDSASIILNEASVKYMGLKNPVGTIIRRGRGDNIRKYTVIGVVKDVLMTSPYHNVTQGLYFMDYNNVNWILLRLNPNQGASQSIAKIETVFKKLIPSAPFEYKFADKEFSAKFAAEERIGKLSTFFAALAIFISCLGLFGLASFVAEQRTKEVGIRKVLGATVTNLWGLLSKDFVILVGISCLISAPIAWLFMHSWLQKYSYRTPITGWAFAVTGFGALLITLFTVSIQAIKAALANPVKSLRSE
ncbi:MAG TPA: ABC transporter permease [Puia sp.]